MDCDRELDPHESGGFEYPVMGGGGMECGVLTLVDVGVGVREGGCISLLRVAGSPLE